MFEDTFIDILNQYPDSIQDKKMFSAILKDYFPQAQMQVNLINNLYTMGIAQDIQNVENISSAFAYRYVKSMVDNYGVSRKNADWATSVWCVCYGQKILHKTCEVKLGSMNQGTAPVIEEANRCMQYGDLFQYVKSNDEYLVCGYTGDKWKTIIFQNQYQNHKVVAISENSFSESNVEEVIMTEGYHRIEHGAFQGCIRLTQVVLSSTLKEMQTNVFRGCQGIKTIMLPASLELIGDYAFASSGLKKISIPSTVYWMGKGIFSYCERLESITLPENLQEIPEEMFKGCSAFRDINLPEHISRLGNGAFQNCESLESLFVPESVQCIGEDVFDGVNNRFILQCSYGSFAEKYARTNKIKYQLV